MMGYIRMAGISNVLVSCMHLFKNIHLGLSDIASPISAGQEETIGPGRKCWITGVTG